MAQLTFDNIMDSIEPDGFSSILSIPETRDKMRAVSFLCLTEQVHPIVALRQAFDNLTLFESVFRGDISNESFVEQMSTSNHNIVLSDDEDPELTDVYVTLFHGIMSACAIAEYKWNMSVSDTVHELDNHDIWADIACNWRDMIVSDPWALGDSFIRFMYKENGYRYTRWDDVYLDASRS